MCGSPSQGGGGKYSHWRRCVVVCGGGVVVCGGGVVGCGGGVVVCGGV